MIVSNLGGKAANYAEWKEVYSENGGEYRMRIAYVPAQGNAREVKDRRLEVEINGQKTCITELESDPAKGVCHVTLPIDLRQGYNSVKIGSAYTWTPDIDCFTLERPVKNKKN